MTDATLGPGGRRRNRLADETSPYLRQHAENPVDWYPWGDEALGRARREDKPIFLSIGYSACHWCHVMERESFEDPRIAGYLNEHFISIKVDREERPDLDEIYMSAVQLMSGQGGWPMSVFLTPTLKPFFGGTYFPPEDRYGRTGFGSLLLRLTEVYRTRRDEIEAGAEQVTERLASYGSVPEGHGLLSPGLVAAAADALLRTFDRTHGGFGGAPKFPHSMGVQLLLRVYRRDGDLRCLEAATLTLDRMAAGGIHDHLGGGFHRYAVDARWLVPHFEKMLYDQALLAVAYLEGWQVTGNEAYAGVVRGILDYLGRDMTSAEGGFFAAEDADSGGAEGLFYTWTPAELAAVLGEEEARLFGRAYDVDEGGNFEGRSILHPVATPESLTGWAQAPPEVVAERLAAARRALLAARGSRERPLRDEKVIAAWNGLVISAFARAGAALGEPRYVEAASSALDFILGRMQEDGRLRRIYMNGRARIPGYLEDYAFVVMALADLFEATFEPRWLAEAVRLSGVMQAEFGDPDGGFFNTSTEHRDLIVRVKNAQDGSIPSGNSMAACALLRVGRLAGEVELERAGERTLRLFQRLMEHAPGAFHQMLLGVALHVGPRREIVIVGPRGDDRTEALLGTARRSFQPRAVLAWTDGTAEGVGASPLLAGKTLVAGAPAAYVCREGTCAAPVTTVEALEEALRA